jgi:diacylglycerol O-acyltransferase
MRRRIAVPAPGSTEQLADIVGDIAGRPLDRSRPLWEF